MCRQECYLGDYRLVIKRGRETQYRCEGRQAGSVTGSQIGYNSNSRSEIRVQTEPVKDEQDRNRSSRQKCSTGGYQEQVMASWVFND